MRLTWFLVCAATTAFVSAAAVAAAAEVVAAVPPDEGRELAVNSWYVRFRRAVSVDEAKDVAARHGFTYIGPVTPERLTDEHHFVHRAVPKLRTRRSLGHTRQLKREALVDFAVQEIGHLRTKRGYKPIGETLKGIRIGLTTQNPVPSDSLYAKEWYLKNVGQAGGTPGLDLNVEAAWAKGYTGKNVTTVIMDDGIDYLHPDLYHNYNAEASYDFSSNDPYPYPRYTDDEFNSHGTRCAGEVAAARDGKNAIGVAYDSKIAALRMLDQPFMTDIIEAKSLGHRQDIIDIYSASWGPKDNGLTVDGPRMLTQRAIVRGINHGRRGKGSIYVWASGDGGPMDDCNCDGYTASMWTISINSVTNDGETAQYDESCSSTLASTFSNGKAGFLDAGVATTDLFGRVTTKHSGTSAAAPEAAGVFALALEANPNITWRDLQHLVVLTSKRNYLHDGKGRHQWKMNGAGLEFNHLFGFGVLDAGDIVDLASVWRPLPERFHCDSGLLHVNRTFNAGNPLRVTVDTTACQGQKNEINFLEHVQAFISVKASRRGDIVMYLTSPMNTRSIILNKRPKDADSRFGFLKWPFMTTQSWAENPRGQWLLEVTLVSDGGRSEGFLRDFTLVLHGTRDSPYLPQRDDGKAHTKLSLAKRLHVGPKFKSVSM